ncbi:hypothetical protein GGS24DRAFT_24500 [Hypoxylon argillaceum]|nr:hypothetical protein GGS24DRAFT_24500 [Hypoxylon argillaceum]
MPENHLMQPKRMRLGTRSCAECRRRKVRCIFAANNSACQECILHQSTCAVQQPKRNSRPQEGTQETLQQRIEDLEGVIRRLCDTINTSTEPLVHSRSESVSCGSSSGTLLTPMSQSTSQSYTVEQDAPVLQLFKQVMMVRWDHLIGGQNQVKVVDSVRMRNCILALQCMIPNRDDLQLIFQKTEHLWPIWPWLPSMIWVTRPLEMSKDFISEALTESKPAIPARAVLWLALCLQQLPRDFGSSCPRLPASPSDLIASYINGADNLLNMDEELGGSLEGLEAMALLSKLYLNMGKPRKCWAIARRAINQALLLGCHRIDDKTDQRTKTNWFFLQQTERQLSMILGFPCAIQESHPSLSNVMHAAGPPAALIGHELSIIAGHVIERHQKDASVDGFTTLKIAQELDECKRRMPPQWWAEPDPDMPLAAAYVQHTIQITYFQLQMYLHLPNMLKATPESNFIDSRVATLEACRGMVNAYQALRSHKDPTVVICDVMDFQVFSAVLVIVIDLLSRPPPDSLQDQADDWQLVSLTAASLKHVSKVMDCAVAQQAAQLLEYLLQARNSTYAGPQTYEAVIPYFGKVRISGRRMAEMPMDMVHSDHGGGLSMTIGSASGSYQSAPLSFPESYNSVPEVQICTNHFFPYGTTPATNAVPEPELSIDWTTALDNIADYDFDQVFDMSSMPAI